MASLQRVGSEGRSYWRIVQSFRRADGKPAVRVLMHLGKADDLLARLRQQRGSIRTSSVSSGAVDAAFALAREFDLAGAINEAVAEAGGSMQVRDGLTIGESLVAAAIARLIHPSSKRAIAAWAAQTTLPERLGVPAAALTSQHFWDQMDAVPLGAIPRAEEAIVRRVLAAESVSPGLLAYDTTNFFTYIDTANARATLAQRGHNKAGRHDLRQLGLALVVSEDGQIPLGHVLYEGARADVRTMKEVIAPLRQRLHRLVSKAAQLTFVFDQGAESKANLAAINSRAKGCARDHFVTALKPSHHRSFLEEVAAKLEPVVLSTGESVRALRTRRLVHGVERTVVVTWSKSLHDGQVRSLEQQLRLALSKIARISRHPRGGPQGARERVRQICNRQYLRQILSCDVWEEGSEVHVRPKIDAGKRADLEERYFGMRILATSRDDWTTAVIIEAYRGQSRVERAFRDLKDPWTCAFRPQYHWTDQKLAVHAFMAIVSLILGRVLLRRAQLRTGFRGTQRSLLQLLSQFRTATFLEMLRDTGRPRLSRQAEDCSPEVLRLAAALGATPP